MPSGFLGTRADLFMDVVIVVVALLPALLGLTWLLARTGRYASHRRLQILLSTVLLAVLSAFEVYVRVKGGLDGLSPGSAWHQTRFLKGFLVFHLVFALSAAAVWGWLVVVSLRRFPHPPTPGSFSARHRRYGRLALILMTLASITGIGLYGLIFVA